MFTILKDAVDNRFNITRDDKSGFYNITKALGQYQKMNPDAPVKKVYKWTRSASAKALIDLVRVKYDIEDAMYVLHQNTANDYKGTYAHPVLYNSFMCWVYQEYQLKMSDTLVDLHRVQGDDIIQSPPSAKKCVGCKFNHGLQVYEGYCYACYANQFPTSVHAGQFQSKENSFMRPIMEIYPSMMLDKVIDGGCSNRRPDGFIDMVSHVVIIEIDENQHQHYDEQCENKRIMELSQDVAHRPIVFVRLNPDKYFRDGEQVDGAFRITDGGVIIKRDDEFNRRLELLKTAVAESTQEQPDSTISTIRICFDD